LLSCEGERTCPDGMDCLPQEFADDACGWPLEDGGCGVGPCSHRPPQPQQHVREL
jgi:hypothetical protein